MNIMFILLTLIMCIFFQIETYTKPKIDQFENSDIYKKYDKVYISFTTIPSRIANIDEMLKSVNVPEVYEIHLNLQSEFEYPEKEIERLNGITPKLKVFWSSDKIGPLTKIVPTLERLLGTNSLIISVDDDMKYSHEYLKDLINLSDNKVTGNSTISEHDLNIHSSRKFKGILDEKFYVFQGFAGILYPANIITQKMIDEMKNLVKLSKECYKSDDLVIGYILTKHNVKKNNAYANRYFVKELNYSKNNGLHNDLHDLIFFNSNIENYYYCSKYINDNNLY